ncbi:MAG: MgtC/SapB family protein, partial [Acidobacteriaceae bacterium]|nr:MgtC/SapB family protein [Acidobacteriaceae bacterium]
AASLSMILANLLASTAGKTPDSFVQLDMMRLPLGILSGMGFIGAGAILRRAGHIAGITTAATLWFLTVIGLCFGAGKIALGLTGTLAGLFTVSALLYVEERLDSDHEATLTIVTTSGGPPEQELRATLNHPKYEITSWGALYSPGDSRREFTCELKWRAPRQDTAVPQHVRALSDLSGVTRVQWSPHSR